MTTADARLERAVNQYVVSARASATAANDAADHVRTLARADRKSVPHLSRSVLVVDDVESVRWAIVESIRQDLGVVVYEAATTSQADAMLARFHPAVIVCDWSLRSPGRVPESGLRWLLDAPRCYRACLVSGHDEVRDLSRECRAIGVRAFLRPTSAAQMAALTSHVRALLDEAAPIAPVSP